MPRILADSFLAGERKTYVDVSFSTNVSGTAGFSVRFPSKIDDSAALCLLILSDQAPIFRPPNIISPHITHEGPALNSYTWPGISQIYACTPHSSACGTSTLAVRLAHLTGPSPDTPAALVRGFPSAGA